MIVDSAEMFLNNEHTGNKVEFTPINTVKEVNLCY